MISAPVMAHRIPSMPMISGRMTRSSPLAISPLIREKIIAGKAAKAAPELVAGYAQIAGAHAGTQMP